MKRKVLIISSIALATVLVGGWALAQSLEHGQGGFGPPFMHGNGSEMMQHKREMMQHMGGGMGPGMMRRTYFAQYGTSTHAYKPRRLNPSVDGSLFVTGMRWELWNAHRARGTGTAHVNDCDPDCADGHYSEHRVTVRLGRPRELCDARFFTSLRLHGPGYHQRSHSSGVGCR